MSETLSRVSKGLPESLKKEYKEVVSEKTSSGSIRHYGIRKSTEGKDPVSAPKLIKAYGYDPKETNPPASGVWSTSHGDIPIKVVGIHGRMNGEDFLKIEGANTGVPRSDIRFDVPQASEIPQTLEFENRLSQMEQRISALESQLQEVTKERDELKQENQELKQKIAQLESGEKPQPTTDSPPPPQEKPKVDLKTGDRISVKMPDGTVDPGWTVKSAEPVQKNGQWVIELHKPPNGPERDIPVSEINKIEVPEPESTPTETLTVVETSEPPQDQTVAVVEVDETDLPPNSTWREKLSNFLSGRSLHNNAIYYRENGILKKEEKIEERDDRWKGAAVVLGGLALLLLIKRYGFDWGDDHHHHHSGIVGDNDSGVIGEIDSRFDKIENRLNDILDADGHEGDMDEIGGDEDTGDNDNDKSSQSAASGSHVEVFNEQHGDRSVQSILPGNLGQERTGLYERIVDRDTGDVIVDHVTYKQNGPYSEATVAKLRSAGYSVRSMPFDIYDTVGPGPRGDIKHYMSVVR